MDSVLIPHIPPLSPVCINDEERQACKELDPKGFFIRHPPKPHLLSSFITPDDQLFQTIHMGAAVIDEINYKIIIDGLVERSFSLTLDQLKRLPKTTITSFHECYGSPVKPPTENLWRIGNVNWTGVPLKIIVELAKPLPEAKFVWSDGLDFGQFGGLQSDRYQKDLPMQKAGSAEVLLAYEMNGGLLNRKRGGPVRLVVPGWFGTNSTKWLCRLSLQPERATGHFTTTFYNEKDPVDLKRGMRPVWMVEPNSMIVSPEPGIVANGHEVGVSGWAWSCEGIKAVCISADDGGVVIQADLEPRIDFGWHRFKTTLSLSAGSHRITCRATSINGIQQPLTRRRNHVHTVCIEVVE